MGALNLLTFKFHLENNPSDIYLFDVNYVKHQNNVKSVQYTSIFYLIYIIIHLTCLPNQCPSLFSNFWICPCLLFAMLTNWLVSRRLKHWPKMGSLILETAFKVTANSPNLDQFPDYPLTGFYMKYNSAVGSNGFNQKKLALIQSM